LGQGGVSEDKGSFNFLKRSSIYTRKENVSIVLYHHILAAGWVGGGDRRGTLTYNSFTQTMPLLDKSYI